MSHSEAVWKEDDLENLSYRVWLLRDRKVSTLIIAVAAIGLIFTLWQIAPVVHLVAFATLVLGLASWRYFIPITVHVTHDGVERYFLGKRQLILWSEIKTYECFNSGISITPSVQRYSLLPLRSTFIPVPLSMIDEVRYRFRFFIDKDIL